jgi:hypothetical protein
MRNLDYVLDLFTIAPSGERERIERFRLRGVSVEDAKRLARAYVKNVLVSGKRVDICAIKTQVGGLIREVSQIDLTEEEARDVASNDQAGALTSTVEPRRPDPRLPA